VKLSAKHYGIGLGSAVLVLAVAVVVKVLLAVITIVAPAFFVGVLLGGIGGVWLKRGRT
jgi:hypothetical protein